MRWRKVCWNKVDWDLVDAQPTELNWSSLVLLVKEERDKEGENADEDEDTPASRLVAALIKHLLRGFQAKDKNVRYRVLYCVAEMISSIGEIECVFYKISGSKNDRRWD